jgi:hypothetical protein
MRLLVRRLGVAVPIDFFAARSFIYANGRLLDQLAYEVAFEQREPESVSRAVLAYQNLDGGFGHGLEPDKRSATSQPLDVELALGYLVAAAAPAPPEVLRAFDFLDAVAGEDGFVPVLLPTVEGYPRAPHWSETEEYPPDVNPTAAIVGYAHRLGCEHPWVTRATDSVRSALEDPPASAHSLLCATQFLEYAPGVDVERLRKVVADALDQSSLFQAHPDPNSYGVGPLQFAPSPDSLAHAWFEPDLLEENLDHLEALQQPDGGWPISWQPPSEASRAEWRAMRTLDAMRTLSAYGRIST